MAKIKMGSDSMWIKGEEKKQEVDINRKLWTVGLSNYKKGIFFCVRNCLGWNLFKIMIKKIVYSKDKAIY